VGVLALSSIRSEYRWPEKLKPRLRLLAEVFTRALKQKQTEKAILQEKKFTETVINSLPGIYYVYDSDWRMVRWNRNHEILTGFSAEELKGRMVLDWFSEDFKEIIATTVRKVFDEGEAMVEAPLLLSDGADCLHRLQSAIYFRQRILRKVRGAATQRDPWETPPGGA
jgi:PAS domain-containing protein